MFIVGLLAESWYSWRFLRTLQHSYPELWEHAGQRTIWTDGNLTQAWVTVSYLINRRYVERNRPEEIAFCERYRMPLTVSYFAAITAVALFLLSAGIVGWPRR